MKTQRTRSYPGATWLVLAGLICSLAVVTPAYAARVAYVSDGQAGQVCTPPCPISGPCVPPPCYITLQEAIDSFANEPDNSGDPVIIEVGTIREKPYGTPTTYNAALTITKSIHIVAAAPNITISGGNIGRPFTIDGTDAAQPINVRISGFAISYGNATDSPPLPGQPNNAHLGGAIYIRNASPVIEYNDIRDNIASMGEGDAFGGGIYVEGGAPIIRFNTFYANSAGYDTNRRGHGGAIAMYNSGAQIIGNRIDFNGTGGKQGIGGGLYLNTDPESGPKPLISGNLIMRNHADGQDPSSAGGIYTYLASPTLENNIVVHNTDHGGMPGLLSDGGTLLLVNNTFADNISDAKVDYRANLTLRFGAQIEAINTIFAGAEIDTGVYIDGAYGDIPPARLTDSHTLFSGFDEDQLVVGFGTLISDNTWRIGDPAFVNTSRAEADYHIQANSAAHDSGAQTNLATDADGRARIGAPDIGAYEYHLDTFIPFAQQ